MRNTQILLVGLRHEFEYVQSANPSTIEQEQRRSFLERVKELIRAGWCSRLSLLLGHCRLRLEAGYSNQLPRMLA